MKQRISLADGIERDRNKLDPIIAQEFVRQGPAITNPRSLNLEPETTEDRTEETKGHRTSTPEEPRESPLKRKMKGAVIAPSPIPIHVRVRPEIASALKAASLDRQMRGVVQSSQKDIIEEALEPWLRTNGFLA